MSIRIVGAVLVVMGTGGFGFLIAASYRREEKLLRQLLNALDYMQCELQYHLTPLPDLCRQVAASTAGVIRLVFANLAAKLEDQITPDVEKCMVGVLTGLRDMPKLTRESLDLLGRSLGRFDLDGQLRGLESVRQVCRHGLDTLEQNAAIRNRSYQTLGLCAGAALAILFI